MKKIINEIFGIFEIITKKVFDKKKPPVKNFKFNRGVNLIKLDFKRHYRLERHYKSFFQSPCLLQNS